MFLDHINRFRGVAILFIVFAHTFFLADWRAYPFIYAMATAVLANGTVLFVFISGFLFNYLSPRFSYKKYLWSKFQNVISPYIAMSVVAVFYVASQIDASFFPNMVGEDFHQMPYWYHVLWLFMTGRHLTAYWYIPMIAMFFLAAPVFRAIDGRPGLYFAIIPLTIVASLAGRPLDGIGALHSAVHFLPVYLFGMWYWRYHSEMSVIFKKSAYAIVLLWVLVFVCKIVLFPGYDNAHYSDLVLTDWSRFRLGLIEKMLLCVILAELLKGMTGRLGRTLDVLASTSFGIFFIHPYLIMIVRAALKGRASNPVVGVLVGVAVVALCAGLSKIVMCTLPRKSRLVIGA